jgi:hypothetical protein
MIMPRKEQAGTKTPLIKYSGVDRTAPYWLPAASDAGDGCHVVDPPAGSRALERNHHAHGVKRRRDMEGDLTSQVQPNFVQGQPATKGSLAAVDLTFHSLLACTRFARPPTFLICSAAFASQTSL